MEQQEFSHFFVEFNGFGKPGERSRVDVPDLEEYMRAVEALLGSHHKAVETSLRCGFNQVVVGKADAARTAISAAETLRGWFRESVRIVPSAETKKLPGTDAELGIIHMIRDR